MSACEISFGNTSAIPMMTCKGCPVGRPFTVSSISRPSEKISSACMEWINYHHLLYFWTVVRAGSIGRASEQLRLAPPTISAQLRSLEGSLGEKLLTRSARGVQPTEVGQFQPRIKAWEVGGIVRLSDPEPCIDASTSVVVLTRTEGVRSVLDKSARPFLTLPKSTGGDCRISQLRRVPACTSSPTSRSTSSNF